MFWNKADVGIIITLLSDKNGVVHHLPVNLYFNIVIYAILYILNIFWCSSVKCNEAMLSEREKDKCLKV